MKQTKTRYRIHPWVDLKKRIPLWGIQMSTKPREWRNTLSTHNGKTVAVLFSDRNQAKSALKTLNSGGAIDQESIHGLRK